MSGIYPDRFELMCDITKQLATFSRGWFEQLHDVEIESKGHADYVSSVDRKAETIARAMISELFPEDEILGEEFGGSIEPTCWVVDPVDGTANFLSGLPFWSVSIAYIEDGIPVHGAVALPALDVLIHAGKENPLTVSGSLPALTSGQAVAFGIGRNLHWSRSHRNELETNLENAGFNIVSLGSCAASLAMVAAGRLAGYVEHNTQIWDCAAGHVLCNSAGALSTIQTNNEDGTTNVIASWDKAESLLTRDFEYVA